MNVRPLTQVFPLLLLCALATPIFSDEPPGQAGKKYALLVGCTKYQLGAIEPLTGPVNDVALWHNLLTSPTGFDFRQEDVTTLVGWSDDPSSRPTYANILAGFEDLVAKAGPNVQIFIQLSGHGVQIPILETQADPLDPRNPEPDGMDEVFLPADVKSWDRRQGIENAILDNQIAGWLNAMRDKGALVWIVFDCCHSGSMTRGRDAEERSRSVNPAALGVPREEIVHAAARARDARKQADGGVELTAKPSPLSIRSNASAAGKLVAFYGCQSFETAPELPRPKGAEHVDENYYGMMSYTLVQTLQERKSPLTYRELSHVLLARYKAERLTRPPTPFAEGDLNVEVLGATVWPNRPDLFLTRNGDKLTVDAGELRGLTPGSVLTVYPPAGDPRGDKMVLGHVRVETATPLSAIVTPCDESGEPGGDPADLDEHARCAVLSRDLGDMRVNVALVPEDKLSPVFMQLDPTVRAMVRIVPEAEADWVLRQVTPQVAADVYSLKEMQNDRVLLLQSEGGDVSDAARKQENERLKAAGKQNLRKIYGGYPVANAKTLVANLERDLQKVFKVQSLWRVAGGLGHNEEITPEHGLQLEVLVMKDEADEKGEVMTAPSVIVGQILGFQIKNEGPDLLAYTVLYCDANFKIEVWGSGQIRPDETLPLDQMLVDDTFGTEGMIVLATPVAALNEAPTFGFLEQEPLGKAETKTRGAGDAPKTAFGQLMSGATFNQRTRGASKFEPTTPAIRSMNWTVLPTTK